MEPKNLIKKDQHILQHLDALRKNIVRHHNLTNLSEFVLHDLCTGPCFSVNKAAYFVNNPDFKFLRGIAGYVSDESSLVSNPWENQKDFISFMQSSKFNQKVRSSHHDYFDEISDINEGLIRKFADDLEIEKPAYHVWNLKHDNHGLLIYESIADEELQAHQHIDSLYYLGFCPIY